MSGGPDDLLTQEADRLYGAPSADRLGYHVLEREIEDLSDKMIQEVMVTFEEEGIELDFSQESLEELDKLVTQHWPEPIEDDDVLDAIVANWGAYLTLLITQNVGGLLRFRKELDHLSVYFERLNWEVFPFHRVRSRFQGNPDSTLTDFYVSLVDRLTND